MSMPRPEHPRPQFFRSDWICLNGEWEFEIDAGDSGRERGLIERPLSRKITLPFCPESDLSGIGHKDFMNAVWYRRVLQIPAAWSGKRALLHFQACDYDTTIWINGSEAINHRGGFTPFFVDLTRFAQPGESVTVVVRARDLAYECKTGGKQRLDNFKNAGCHYFRTTGIWQTVWMEAVGQIYLQRPRLTPDVANSCLRVEQPVCGRAAGMTLRAVLKDAGGAVADVTVAADADFNPQLTLTIPPARLKLWQPGTPHLYDLELTLLDAGGTVVDRAASYAGMRSISLQGNKFLINGRNVFQRQVLDQGYYPDGIMTAPSDEALKNDITLALAAGFNSARLHQKLFEERFLYHADRMGYLVWGEFGDWGVAGRYAGSSFRMVDPWGNHPQLAMIRQWAEALERDYSHPCIIGWCPLNETSRDSRETDRINVLDDLTAGLFLVTKNADRTRPVLDTSGYCHRVYETDVYDCHDYDQNPQTVIERHARTAQGEPFINTQNNWDNLPYRGQPYFCSEFGGIKWSGEPDSRESWGYGESPKSEAEFFARFQGLCGAFLDNPAIFGYCYTQLTDVCQEQNGLYCFDRRPKFDPAKYRQIQSRKAAIED